MKKVFFALALLCFSSLFGTSLTLKNDSPYVLRATIQAADNSFLGEMILQPKHSAIWNDIYGYGTNYSIAPNAQEALGSRSKTPYTVIWQCVAGGEYSINRKIATGSIAYAQTGEGNRSCSGPTK